MAYDALLIFGLVFITHILTTAYSWYTTRDDRTEKRRLEAELRPLQNAMKLYEGNMDYFVALSKLQRQANVLEEKLKAVKSKLGETSQMGGALGILDKVMACTNPKKWYEQAKASIVQTLCGVAIAYYWWGVPLFVFPVEFFWPFNSVIGQPWLPTGSLGAVGWYVVCTRAVPRITATIYGVME